MKKNELVYCYILEQTIEKRRRKMTQAEIAKALAVSLSTVNAAIGHLRKMGAVRVRLRDLEIVDARKILLYWSSIRNLDRDIVYMTRVDAPAGEIEKSMPPGVIYAAYSAYKIKYGEVPADYSEVYAYGEKEEVRRRFPEIKGRPNLFVLRKDIKKMSIANIFADLWNMKEWYAKEFLNALEKRLDGILK